MAENERFKPIPINGGSIRHMPAGTFTEEGTNRIVNYDEKVKINYMGREYGIPPAALAAVYQAIRDSKDLQDFLGVRSGILG
jgi:hypothetical protein